MVGVSRCVSCINTFDPFRNHSRIHVSRETYFTSILVPRFQQQSAYIPRGRGHTYLVRLTSFYSWQKSRKKNNPLPFPGIVNPMSCKIPHDHTGKYLLGTYNKFSLGQESRKATNHLPFPAVVNPMACSFLIFIAARNYVPRYVVQTQIQKHITNRLVRIQTRHVKKNIFRC